ncbi:hypothetical protein KEM60_01131 [Austwickia sp. TVS 96-490-7B]|uniref:hypothetical protein n=1 Tax=Austwickia sp. TVS 96-490-7B TaxID=2830843 RepID=UPI001C55EF0F|nr:hypothetical protein [Austwickia sp. TVS 96-490-7B]MBW3084940.1 hypothetical protein [Austwickia sp. TVS 96-490-7B]
MVDADRSSQNSSEKRWLLHVQALGYVLIFLVVYIADKSLRVGGYQFHDYVIAAVVHVVFGYPFALGGIIFIQKLKEKYN